jgi:hypothetical protein
LIVSAHQPHFLPWLGYFNKVAKSDVFVWLENVQFRKNYFQNRTKIKVGENEFWLTVPVKKASLDTQIAAIEIDNSKAYKKIGKTLLNAYSKAPFFSEFFPEFQRLLESNGENLNALNFELFQYLISVLEIPAKIERSSAFQLENEDPNDRLIEICSKLNATHYIAGKGGSNYMNRELFQNNNIEILWQQFPVGDIEYPQKGKNFIKGLSVIDALFHVGAEKTRELIFTEWKD